MVSQEAAHRHWLPLVEGDDDATPKELQPLKCTVQNRIQLLHFLVQEDADGSKHYLRQAQPGVLVREVGH
eukprot:CAMPEP_0115727746 /NCGR_PEP_ID=MMETSP0272-20121206/82584_1 /TAXON_ID=71861 /ORGANISM="Scrippsiella trochoidea, Strain CCMP3099" /LENGTH=69 /DNA_ID=CAMNT_0003171273 /DNA_START=142 /DNA_END=351 /DNA_ORIENTATION=+